MNTIESYIMSGPFGAADECAKITIDDPSQAYTMPDVMVADKEYTLSFWVRSDNGGVITVCGSQINTPTSKWQKQVITFTASKQNLTFAFGNIGVYYIYQVKLEKGNKATDWTPAPEDTEQSIDDVNESVSTKFLEQTASIINTCEGIILSAAEKYVETSDYEDFRKDIEAQLSMTANAIVAEFNSAFAELGPISDQYDKLRKSIAFDKNGITISTGSERAVSLHIDNDLIYFEKDGVPSGTWDGKNFNTGNIRVEVEERAQFGNFAFIPRRDGSLSFLKVEHNTGFYARLASNTMSIYGVHPTLEDNVLIISEDDKILSTLDGTTLTLVGQNLSEEDS